MCSRNTLCVGSLSLWRGAKFDIAGATFSQLCMSDRSRCGAVRILASLAQPSRNFVHFSLLSLWCVKSLSLWPGLISADSLRSWWQDLVSSLKGPSMMILQEFHGAVLEVLNTCRSWPRSCRAPCEKMLWSSWWNPSEVLAFVQVFICLYEKILWRSFWNAPRGPWMILRRSL